MVDRKAYKLDDKNYVKVKTNKTRIVIGNTFCTDMKHFIGWKTRLNGYFKQTAAFTIRLNGEIYQHYSPKYFSNFLGEYKLDKSTIPVVLENEGWLEKDLNDKNRFVNNIRHIYKREDEVYNKRWRNMTFWAPYSEQQEKSLVELVKYLCSKYGISKKAISHNTNFKQVEDYDGILYRSNFNKYFTDVNPNWNFEEVKNNIEKKDSND